MNEQKALRKAQTRERFKSMVDQRRHDDEEQRRQILTSMLQPDESIEALLKTAETVMKKYVLLTSKRVLVAPVHDPRRAETILYRSITGFGTSNFITKDIALDIIGRRDRLELRFETAEDRDRALDVLNARTV